MKPATATDLRRRELAQIHIAVQQLGLTDDDHRSLLWSVCQVKSAADLDWTGRKRYLDHLKKLGFKPRTKVGKPSQPRPRTGTPVPSSRPLAQDAESRKIRALWIMLHQLGAVRNPSEESLAAYVKRIAKVDALQWITGEQAETVIETLKKWSMRFLPEKLDQQIVILRDELNNGLRSDVNEMNFGRLNDLVNQAYARKTFDAYETAYSHIQQILKSANDSAK